MQSTAFAAVVPQAVICSGSPSVSVDHREFQSNREAYSGRERVQVADASRERVAGVAPRGLASSGRGADLAIRVGHLAGQSAVDGVRECRAALGDLLGEICVSHADILTVF